MRVNDRSKAKSSAANIKPSRYGEAVQISRRLVIAWADSMRAIIFIGFFPSFSPPGEEGCRAGN